MLGKKMNIMIITPYADPEKGACVVRVNAFRDFFTARGHKVSVYAPQRQGVPMVTGVWRYASILELMGKVSTGKFDAVIGTSPPITHNFFSLIAAKISGTKFLLDAKDPFTAIIGKMTPARAGTLKFRLFEFMEWFTHKFSDRVMFLSRPLMENALDKFGFERENAVLASNGADTKKVYYSEVERERVRKRLGLRKSVTIVYMGGVGDKDITGFIQNSFPVLAKKHGVRAIFILSHEKTPLQERLLGEIKSTLEQNSLSEKVRFLYSVAFEELYKYLSAADVGLVPYPNFEMPVVLVKLYDCIAAGLPIAAKEFSGNQTVKGFIEENRVGFHSKDWEEFNNKFISMFLEKKLPSRRSIIKIAARNSREEGCKRVMEEITRITQTR